MTTPFLEHWQRCAPQLERYRLALRDVVAALARGQADAAALNAAVQREPDPSTHTPAVDAHGVDLGGLERAMEEFWAAYYGLPLPPGCDASRYTYRHLPAPLPLQHRATLDQCLRVLLTLYGWRGTSEHGRLQGLVLGYTHRLPGIEDLADRYSAIAIAEWEESKRGPKSPPPLGGLTSA